MHNVGPELVPAAFAANKTHYMQLTAANSDVAQAGLAWNSGGLAASYAKHRSARVAITLATQTVTGAYSEGGFVEVDGTNMPGVYRLDLPDAMFSSSYTSVVLSVLFTNIEYTATFIEPWTSVNAIADGVWDEQLSGHTTEGSGGSVLNASATASSIWGAAQSAYTTPGTFGYLLDSQVSSGGATILPLTARQVGKMAVMQDITLYQNTAGDIVWSILDDNDNPEDLSGKTIRFNVSKTSADTAEWTQAGVVGGAKDNQITVTYTTTNTATSRDFEYDLWNITDDVILKKGALNIIKTVKDAAV